LFRWFTGYKGLLNWFKVLRAINDDTLVEITGVDYALYLVFLRYAAVLCLVLTMVNCFVLVPIYASGDPVAQEGLQWSSMNVLTLLNITGNNHKMRAAYFITLFIVPVSAFVLLVKYLLKY